MTTDYQDLAHQEIMDFASDVEKYIELQRSLEIRLLEITGTKNFDEYALVNAITPENYDEVMEFLNDFDIFMGELTEKAESNADLAEFLREIYIETDFSDQALLTKVLDFLNVTNEALTSDRAPDVGKFLEIFNGFTSDQLKNFHPLDANSILSDPARWQSLGVSAEAITETYQTLLASNLPVTYLGVQETLALLLSPPHSLTGDYVTTPNLEALEIILENTDPALLQQISTTYADSLLLRVAEWTDVEPSDIAQTLNVLIESDMTFSENVLIYVEQTISDLYETLSQSEENAVTEDETSEDDTQSEEQSSGDDQTDEGTDSYDDTITEQTLIELIGAETPDVTAIQTALQNADPLTLMGIDQGTAGYMLRTIAEWGEKGISADDITDTLRALLAADLNIDESDLGRALIDLVDTGAPNVDAVQAILQNADPLTLMGIDQGTADYMLRTVTNWAEQGIDVDDVTETLALLQASDMNFSNEEETPSSDNTITGETLVNLANAETPDVTAFQHALQNASTTTLANLDSEIAGSIFKAVALWGEKGVDADDVTDTLSMVLSTQLRLDLSMGEVLYEITDTEAPNVDAVQLLLKNVDNYQSLNIDSQIAKAIFKAVALWDERGVDANDVTETLALVLSTQLRIGLSMGEVLSEMADTDTPNIAAVQLLLNKASNTDLINIDQETADHILRAVANWAEHGIGADDVTETLALLQTSDMNFSDEALVETGLSTSTDTDETNDDTTDEDSTDDNQSSDDNQTSEEDNNSDDDTQSDDQSSDDDQATEDETTQAEDHVSDTPADALQETYLISGHGNDTITGGRGVDTAFGNAGDDTLYGHEGDDFLFGGTGNDTLFGDADNDFLDGGSGNDTIHGGTGDDTIFARTGDDTLFGDDGDDIIHAGLDGIKTIDGGEGNDTLVLKGKIDDYVFEETDSDTGIQFFLEARETVINVSNVEKFVFTGGDQGATEYSYDDLETMAQAVTDQII